MTDENRLKYEVRMERLLRLIRLQAPAPIIARECALIAGAVYDIKYPIELMCLNAGVNAPPSVTAELDAESPDEEPESTH